LRTSALGSNSLDGLDDFHSFDDFTEYDVLAVQLEKMEVKLRVKEEG
jgi:hypothetical protein